MTAPPSPYAPPAENALRVPNHASGDLFQMRSGFSVGPHLVEIETGHWNGTEVYRIDGQALIRKRNLGWHANQTLEVGGHTVAVNGRWYPLFPVTVDVDGRRYIDDLFPQLHRLTRVIGATALVLMGLFTASIAWDVYRWLGPN